MLDLFLIFCIWTIFGIEVQCMMSNDHMWTPFFQDFKKLIYIQGCPLALNRSPMTTSLDLWATQFRNLLAWTYQVIFSLKMCYHQQQDCLMLDLLKFFSNFRTTSSFLWEPLLSLFWTSGDVCPMLESISHFLYLGDLNPRTETRHEACCYLRTWTPARLYQSPVDPVAESTELPSSSQIYGCYWTCPSHPCIYKTNYMIKIRAD